MKRLSLVIAFFPVICFANSESKVLKERIHFNGTRITVEVHEGKNLIVLRGKNKKLAEFKDRHCVSSPVVVKINNKKTDFLYCLEEVDMNSYQGLLIGPGEKGKIQIIYSGPARGILEDYDGDGLLDFLKVGGNGEPVSDKATAYDPYLVYKQVRSGTKIDFKIDEALSEKYSVSRNFKWHGAMYSEDTVVDKSGNIVK